MGTYGAVDNSSLGSKNNSTLEGTQIQTRFNKSYIVFAASVVAVIFIVSLSTSSTPSKPSFESYYGDGDIGTHLKMFEDFQQNYKKSYKSDDEKQLRFQMFRENLAAIDALNAAAVASKKSTTYGLNHFADMSHIEWKDTVLMDRSQLDAPVEYPGQVAFDISSCTACTRFPELSEYHADNLPTDFDWRDYGAVTEVKNQVYCGSCWSFGTTGDIEGVYYLAGSDLTSLSEQQLISCDTKYDFGCDGGWQEAAFENIITRGGIVSDDDLPYLTVNMDNVRSGPSCNENIVNSDNYVVSISSWAYVSTSKSEEVKMALALVRQGPLTLAINADPMMFYKSGIDDPDGCDPEELDHAVLLVGYGVEDGVDYWLIKNSWADYWGEDGYYRIIRGVNKCGVALEVSHSYL